MGGGPTLKSEFGLDSPFNFFRDKEQGAATAEAVASGAVAASWNRLGLFFILLGCFGLFWPSWPIILLSFSGALSASKLRQVENHVCG